jgi:hypothetical protein
LIESVDHPAARVMKSDTHVGQEIISRRSD